MKLLLAITCLWLFSTACKRTMCCGLPPGIELVRTQTQCADSWGYGSSNDETIIKLKNYLLQKQVVVSRITLQSTGQQVVCDACTCSRGFVFHVWTADQYTTALTAEGFTIK